MNIVIGTAGQPQTVAPGSISRITPDLRRDPRAVADPQMAGEPGLASRR